MTARCPPSMPTARAMPLARLETMTLMAGMDLPLRAVREQIASAVQLILHQQRGRDGSRRVTHVTEVSGMAGDVDQLAGHLSLGSRAAWTPKAAPLGDMRPTGLRPAFAPAAGSAGRRAAAGAVFVTLPCTRTSSLLSVFSSPAAWSMPSPRRGRGRRGGCGTGWIASPAAFASRRLPNRGTPTPPGLRPDSVPTVTRWLGGSDWEKRLRLAMIRADLRLRPGEWVALCAASATAVVPARPAGDAAVGDGTDSGPAGLLRADADSVKRASRPGDAALTRRRRMR